MICPRTVCPNHDSERTQITGATQPLASCSTKSTAQTSSPSRRFDQRIIRRNHPRPKRARRRDTTAVGDTPFAKAP